MKDTFFDLVAKRNSVRKFSDQAVEEETIVKILGAARLAPSAVNYQPWRFIVVTDDELKAKIAQGYSRAWFQTAPVVIVACGDHDTSWKRQDGKDHVDVDVAIAVDHLTLAAASLDLGTCWVCAFDAEKVHSALELPSNLEVIALIPLGYPQREQAPAKKRKELTEIVSWNGL